MKNTGKASEEIFDDFIARQGKGFCLIPFEDQAALVGLNKGKIMRSSAKPCDRIVISISGTSFCEIKSTHNKTSFPFSMLRDGQTAYAKKITTASGIYFVFVHNKLTNRWYRIPWKRIEDQILNGVKSLKWTDLEDLRFQPLEAYH